MQNRGSFNNMMSVPLDIKQLNCNQYSWPISMDSYGELLSSANNCLFYEVAGSIFSSGSRGNDSYRTVGIVLSVIILSIVILLYL